MKPWQMMRAFGPVTTGGGGGVPVTWDEHVAALPGLWGWWKLDEDSGAGVQATDSSGNARHGSYSADGTKGAGLFAGSAASQTSLGGRVDVPNWVVPATPAFTVGAIIKTTHASGVEQNILSGDGGSGSRVFQFNKNTSSHALNVVIIVPTVVALTGTTAINDGDPHLAIFVFDQSLPAADGRMRLYLDGVENARSTTAVTMASGPTADLGIGARNGSGSTGLWQGGIDEAFFCNGALSAAEIAALWAARNL